MLHLTFYSPQYMSKTSLICYSHFKLGKIIPVLPLHNSFYTQNAQFSLPMKWRHAPSDLSHRLPSRHTGSKQVWHSQEALHSNKLHSGTHSIKSQGKDNPHTLESIFLKKKLIVLSKCWQMPWSRSLGLQKRSMASWLPKLGNIRHRFMQKVLTSEFFPEELFGFAKYCAQQAQKYY